MSWKVRGFFQSDGRSVYLTVRSDVTITTDGDGSCSWYSNGVFLASLQTAIGGFQPATADSINTLTTY